MNTRDRGICLYLAQRFGDAIDELQLYLDTYTAAVDRAAIEGAPALTHSQRHALERWLTARTLRRHSGNVPHRAAGQEAGRAVREGHSRGAAERLGRGVVRDV